MSKSSNLPIGRDFNDYLIQCLPSCKKPPSHLTGQSSRLSRNMSFDGELIPLTGCPLYYWTALMVRKSFPKGNHQPSSFHIMVLVLFCNNKICSQEWWHFHGKRLEKAFLYIKICCDSTLQSYESASGLLFYKIFPCFHLDSFVNVCADPTGRKSTWEINEAGCRVPNSRLLSLPLISASTSMPSWSDGNDQK